MKLYRTTWLALTFGWLAAVASAQNYALVDLTAGSPFQDTGAYGISQNGHVTGYGTNPVTQELHAFIYFNGTFQDLGDLGYVNGAQGSLINDNGQMSGVGYPESGYQCFLYSKGVAKTIGGNFTEPSGMNSVGDMVGRERRDDGGSDAFSYIGGNYTSLTNLISANGINDSDVYVGAIGYFWYHNGVHYVIPHGYIFLNGSYLDLGNIGGGVGGSTEAYSINKSNQVTGYSTAADGTVHAFLYSGDSMSDLGTFPPYYTYGTSINDSGQVAGNIEYFTGAPFSAFLYSNGVMKDLSSIVDSSGAGWSQLVAFQINNNGYIVGYGTLNNGTHGFLARPYYPISPLSYAIGAGKYVSGNAASLANADQNYLVVQAGPSFSNGAPPLSIVVTGTSSLANPADVRLQLTGHADSVDLAETVEFYDYVANGWVLVDSTTATMSDSNVTAIATNPARFVQSGTLQMKARISLKPSGPISKSPWSIFLDQAVWNVSP